MASATWPVSLPQEPLMNAFQQTFGNGTARTEMDAGPAKVRRRFTAVVDKVTTRFLLTETQMQTLRTFYKDTLKQGSLAFDWENFLTGNSVEYRFTTEPTIGKIANDLYSAECEMEILP